MFQHVGLDAPECTLEPNGSECHEVWYACACCGFPGCVSWPGDVCYSCYIQAQRTMTAGGVEWNPAMGRIAPEHQR